MPISKRSMRESLTLDPNATGVPFYIPEISTASRSLGRDVHIDDVNNPTEVFGGLVPTNGRILFDCENYLHLWWLLSA